MKTNFKTSTKNTLLTGKNIYQDSHGNIIFFDEKKNISYRIPANKQNAFATFRSRYALVTVCFVFLYILFNLNLILSIGLCAAIAVFLELRYRSFLKNLVHSNGLGKKEKLKSMDDTLELTKGAILLRIVLYLLLAVLLVINTFVSSNVIGNKPLIVISDMVAVLAAYVGIRYILLFTRK